VIGPTGDGQGQNLANYQSRTLAAMEAHFDTKSADLVILGQPNVETKSIDNPLVVPHALSFLISRNWRTQVRGLSSFPESEWPTNISLLYYSYHIMVGLGTIFMAVMLISGIQLWRRKLYQTRWLLWVLLLSFPLPYIANTAGWMTAEIGRQPYLVYGVMRTVDGFSKSVSAANAWKLYQTRWLRWVLLLTFPLPYIATTAGWMTAEIGDIRQREAQQKN